MELVKSSIFQIFDQPPDAISERMSKISAELARCEDLSDELLPLFEDANFVQPTIDFIRSAPPEVSKHALSLLDFLLSSSSEFIVFFISSGFLTQIADFFNSLKEGSELTPLVISCLGGIAADAPEARLAIIGQSIPQSICQIIDSQPNLTTLVAACHFSHSLLSFPTEIPHGFSFKPLLCHLMALFCDSFGLTESKAEIQQTISETLCLYCTSAKKVKRLYDLSANYPIFSHIEELDPQSLSSMLFLSSLFIKEDTHLLPLKFVLDRAFSQYEEVQKRSLDVLADMFGSDPQSIREAISSGFFEKACNLLFNGSPTIRIASLGVATSAICKCNEEELDDICKGELVEMMEDAVGIAQPGIADRVQIALERIRSKSSTF